MTDFLSMWVIYDHPRDYPRHFVIRRHAVRRDEPSGPTEDYSLHATLEDARDNIPAHCVRLERDPNDDPTIIEVWI